MNTLNLRYLLLFSTIFLVSATTAHTATHHVPNTNIILNYDIYDQKVRIFWCDTSAEGELVIPSKIEDYPVTTIASGAFSNCAGLTSVTIPDSVTNIGENAFSRCSGLSEVTLPNSITSIDIRTFYYCTALTNVTVPDSVTTIGEEAFSFCTELSTVTISLNVTSISLTAFDSCDSLTNISVASDNASYSSTDGILFDKSQETLIKCPAKTQGSYSIPSSVTAISPRAFSNCTELTSLTIADSVTNIGEAAFSECTSLTNITIPENVTSIGPGAFSDCSGLESLIISGNLAKIDEYTFAGCTALTSLSISDSVTEIGNFAFSFCTALSSVTIPNNVTEIGNYAFNDCNSLTSVSIPSSVRSIGENAFSSCRALANLTIPVGVETIGAKAFSYASLTSIEIPDSVTEIGSEAFFYCTSLMSVSIGVGLESIGDRPFYGCASLNSISVNPNNSFYTSNEGVLFDKALLSLIKCPVRKEGSYVIPPSVTTIEAVAFEGCYLLTSLSISENVTEIGDSVFTGCELLRNIHVAPNNGSFSSAEGVLFDKAQTTLIKYPVGKDGSYSIPSTVTKVAQSAFRNSNSLTKIWIPESVTTIGDWAFGECSALTKATFERDAPYSFGNNVFVNAGVGFTVRFHENVNGFTAPTWNNFPSSLLADSDKDGWIDEWEALLGTDSNDANSRLRLWLDPEANNVYYAPHSEACIITVERTADYKDPQNWIDITNEFTGDQDEKVASFPSLDITPAFFRIRINEKE